MKGGSNSASYGTVGVSSVDPVVASRIGIPIRLTFGVHFYAAIVQPKRCPDQAKASPTLGSQSPKLAGNERKAFTSDQPMRRETPTSAKVSPLFLPTLIQSNLMTCCG